MDRFDREVSAQLKRVANDNIRFTQEDKAAVRRNTYKMQSGNRRFQPVYWAVLASAATLFLFLGFIYATDSGLLEAGPDTDYMTPASNGEMGYTVQDLEDIDYEIVEESQLDETTRLYTVEVVNGTEHDIIDAVFNMSHPIKIENGLQGNAFQAESRLYNIAPGETVRFDMELPTGIFDSEQVDVESESMKLNGYLNEMKGENIFQIGRSNGVVEAKD